MKQKVCRTCAYYDGDEQVEEVTGFCRRYPPRPFGFEDDDEKYGIYNPALPIVASEDWCGEWKLKDPA